ncbi:hypothetical protein ADZ36_10545 [Streptomyces fradiae]|uniref:Uncharacterized protein n=1 Tax=Streptomyces fradiae TaxID=1906 RepID=A0ACC4WCR0_STRFR|nr:hypothetical protein ADZ36_10545 [Streptomyces fradiae]
MSPRAAWRRRGRPLAGGPAVQPGGQEAATGGLARARQVTEHVADQFQVRAPPPPHGVVQLPEVPGLLRRAAAAGVPRQSPDPEEQLLELLRLQPARRAEPVPEPQEVLPAQGAAQQRQLPGQGVHQPYRPVHPVGEARPAAPAGVDVSQVDEDLAEQDLGRLVHDDEQPLAVAQVPLLRRGERLLRREQFVETQVRGIGRVGHRANSSG